VVKWSTANGRVIAKKSQVWKTGGNKGGKNRQTESAPRPGKSSQVSWTGKRGTPPAAQGRERSFLLKGKRLIRIIPIRKQRKILVKQNRQGHLVKGNSRGGSRKNGREPPTPGGRNQKHKEEQKRKKGMAQARNEKKPQKLKEGRTPWLKRAAS